MTHELGPDARALLDAARDGLGPDAAAIRRMRQQIDASVATGPVGGALAAKLGAVAVVASIAIGALVFRGRDRDQLAPRLELPAAQVEPGLSPSAPAVHETAPRAQPEPAHIEMAPMPARVAGHLAPAVPVPAAARAGFDFGREVKLFDQADAALRRHDPAAALAAVRTHAAETGGAGQLTEDLAAIEIEALCRLHDPITAAKLDAFDARWPQSAHRSRLSTTCR